MKLRRRDTTTESKLLATMISRASPSALLSRFGAERVARWEPSTFEIAGPLQFTRGGTYCNFVLGGQPWEFRSREDRYQLWDQATYRWASLRGRTVRLRSTTRPYPAYEWARQLDEDVNPLPDVPGALPWDEYLGCGQMRLRHTGLDTKLVTLAVWIGPNPRRKVIDELVDGPDEEPSKEARRVLEEIKKVTTYLEGKGFDARPMRPREMAFLMHRSLSMGVPAPAHAGVAGDRWEPDDVLGFWLRREWLYNPWVGQTVRIVAERDGQLVERHVAVLSVGPMPDLQWPESGRDPFMLPTDRLGFPVEWSLSGAMLTAKDLAPIAEHEQNRANGIRKHYAEHDIEPPPSVYRAIRQAGQNHDEITEGDLRQSIRFAGPIRIATYAPTADEALEQAREIVDLYGERHRIEIQHPRGQAQMLREFVPGEPWATKGHQRRLPARYLAAAMPHVSSEVGTPNGFYLGYGVGSARRAMLWNPHYSMERLNAPGLVPISAEPGAGKSVLIGVLAFNCARAGQPTIINDPSGPLARLCEMPELKPYARTIDLSGAEAGTLAPHQMVPIPRADEFRNDATGQVDEVQHLRQMKRAVAERQQLLFDVCRMWLPASLLRSARVDLLLQDALRRTRYRVIDQGLEDTQTNPRWVLEELRHATSGSDDADLARMIIAEMESAAEFPLGELIMPEHSDPIDPAPAVDKTLVVVTMPGLEPPPEGLDRADWGSSERYTQPLLHLGAFFTSRYIYSRDRKTRKNVFLDENHLMARWGSGRALYVRLARDSRKWDTAVFSASQHPDDHLGVQRLDALQGAAFVGRLTNEKTAQRACELLQAPEQYASVIQSLSPKPRGDEGGIDAGANDKRRASQDTGEFVVRDPFGRIGRVRIDIDWYPGLRDVLNTTPGRWARPAAGDSSRREDAPFIDPELFEMVARIEAA